ncbi:RNA polymerase sigma-70 factor [Algoriphagus halophytocola]|uniref:RNA polymerase sigma-70 factor n=1 Tax=Algoriphagus halophytocola TaxID=2991499 RepID=A0ABY6MHY2_9BACT|nr:MULTISPECIES: RNA polymerase sigma-70 factor [unclassified Algoriphagus]UZD23074.1 RNA polymerase sigma-70 factor [Algoriphagus sp. TR-M5]WBL44366.1 RNA polymerase sigma-70 factor [Algoriphagus sp. TR-M9]
MPNIKSHTVLSDQELVALLQSDDFRAFDELYSRYAPKLLGFSSTFFQVKAEAEDVVQEVFLKVWERRSKLKPDLNFSSFLFTSVKNRIYNKLRDQKNNVPLEDFELDAIIDESTLGQDNYYESRKQVAFELLNQLPATQRNVFTLSKLEGYSHHEIAQMLDISVRTVDHHIYLAKKYIKSTLFEKSPLAILITLMLLA